MYNLKIKKRTADGLWVNRVAEAKAAERAAEEEAAFQTDPTLEEVMLEAEAEKAEPDGETKEEQHGETD